MATANIYLNERCDEDTPSVIFWIDEYRDDAVFFHLLGDSCGDFDRKKTKDHVTFDVSTGRHLSAADEKTARLAILDDFILAVTALRAAVAADETGPVQYP